MTTTNRMDHTKWWMPATFILLFAHSTNVSAGGIFIYEAGQESNGLANAGSAALATDPSVLMSNPAGIALLPGTQISANAQVILGDLRYSRDSSNQFDGNEGGNALQYLPGASLFSTLR